MRNNVKVTIVVAIYKSEQFLEKLLNSIISQSYQNLEIILVDDGSPDCCPQICDEYANRDSRIKVIHKVNGGACSARNEGISAATGEYITIIDGDDWLEEDYVEYLVNLAVSNDADMALTDRIFTTRDRVQTQKDFMEIWTAEKAATNIIYPYIPIGPWNKLYRLDMLIKNGISFSVPWSGEGLYFSFMAAQNSNKVAVGHRKIYDYRMNNTGSGLTHYNVQMGINALYNIKNIKQNNILHSQMIDDAVNWHIWKNYNFLLKLIIATDSKEKYAKEYAECIKSIRRILPAIVNKNPFGFKTRVKMVLISLFPTINARMDIEREQRELEKDLKEFKENE